MIKIDIFSGFLGAGKTTLIKKLIKEAYYGEKLVLIENEFGTIGIDGEFLKDSGVQINELNSGCICCSLVGDFSEALKQVINDYCPDRILIEPSGVGKLSDVIRAVEGVNSEDVVINGLTAIADANKCKMYMKNFGEFFNDQIENAGCIVLSHTDNVQEDKLHDVINAVKKHNSDAVIISTAWEQLNGKEILSAIERKDTLENALKKLSSEEECPVCSGHHHHEHGHCEHEHHHNHNCCEHDYYEYECCEHGHHHDHDGECCCHEHHHDGHHHLHADDVFTSWGIETVKKYTQDEIANILKQLKNEDEYGMILRAKGIVASSGNEWIHFDYVPGEADIRYGSCAVCGRICVIGSKINEEKISKLFC